MMRILQILFFLAISFAFISHPPKRTRWDLQGERVDPLNINEELLKKSVIDFINYKRTKTRRKIIELNTQLDSIIQKINIEHKNKDLFKKKKKARSNFYLKAWEIGYTNSWFKVMYSESVSLMASGKAVYYNPELNGFCWGTKKALKDTSIKSILVPKMTYRQLAKRLIYRSLPGSNRRWINNSDVSKIGIHVKVNKKGNPDKIPSVELFFILSGNVMPLKL